MRLLPILALFALPVLVTSLPTPQAEATYLLPRAENAGIVLKDGIFGGALVANGGCGPNFGNTVTEARVFAGFRCRFYRYVTSISYYML